MRYLASLATDERSRHSLQRLVELEKSRDTSVLDLLEEHPDIILTLEDLVSMIPPIRPRTYSISSSPLWNAHRATITWSVVDQKSIDTRGKHSPGVASNYLAGLIPGNLLHASVRSPNIKFSLPNDPGRTPVIMIAAGSGLAPFRGFCQERAVQIHEGMILAPAVLFFGCRRSGLDDIYRDEFNTWEKSGVVTVYRAYSRPNGSGTAQTAGRYVQDVVHEHAGIVSRLWEQGARCYVCGSAKMAEHVKVAFGEILCGSSANSLASATKDWLSQQGKDRFLTDVFL
jgi:cytochrome P450/NADPH-cytochrome P450 reductase